MHSKQSYPPLNCLAVPLFNRERSPISHRVVTFMAVRQYPVAVVSFGVAAAVCASALLAVTYREHRGHRRRVAGRQTPVNPATDRRAPEDDQQIFSLYEGVDAEPHAPPMELSGGVLALLESFDVDPVRGESWRVLPPAALPAREI